ncbi:condensation domain-containing protein [Corynebacterium glyciniphilum]|uniref:condensation domain-containing protein n=1 Tax=Corynebacterium glyciniphilum TaxID=1404244 RepID=UPI003DA0236E
MEYTELSAYRLHAGHVTTWTPTATDAWAVDPRPLSSNHEAHVRESLSSPSTGAPGESPRGDNWIGTAFRIHHPFDAEVFSATLRLWMVRHEAYRTTAVAGTVGDTGVEGDALHRETLPADAVDVSSQQVGHLPDAGSVHDFLDRHFATEVSALRWPHLTVATVGPDAESAGDPAVSLGSQDGPWFTVVFAADHAVMDAYTQIVSIAELREIYAAQLADRTPELPLAGSHVDYSRVERDLADSLTVDHPVVQRWRDFLVGAEAAERASATPRLPLAGAHSDAERDVQQVSTSMWLLGEVDATVFGQLSKRYGGSQVTGLLAALKVAAARADRDGLCGDTFRYVMPMHTRTSPEFALSAGWFVGLMPVEDPMPRGAAFSEAVSATTAAVKENRDLVAYPYPKVAELLEVTEPPRFVVSYVDTRFIPGAEDWTPHDRTLRGVAYSSTDVYIWVVRTKGGVNISMRYPDAPCTRDSVRALVAEYFAVLHSVVDTGDAASLPFGAAEAGETAGETVGEPVYEG